MLERLLQRGGVGRNVTKRFRNRYGIVTESLPPACRRDAPLSGQTNPTPTQEMRLLGQPSDGLRDRDVDDRTDARVRDHLDRGERRELLITSTRHMNETVRARPVFDRFDRLFRSRRISL
jgi:hypothetical protein